MYVPRNLYCARKRGVDVTLAVRNRGEAVRHRLTLSRWRRWPARIVISGRLARRSQLSTVVRPTLKPPCSTDAVARPRVDGQTSNAVPVLDLLPVVVGERREVVDRADVARLIVESASGLSAQFQARIDRRRDAVAGEVARSHRAVVDDREVAEPAPEVAEIHRDAWRNLLLDADGEFLVPRPVAPSRDRSSGRWPRWAELTEERVVQRAAVAVGAPDCSDCTAAM